MIYFDHQCAIFPHSARMAESARGRRDEDGPEINSENDARVREQAARACHHHIRHRRIQNVLHFRIRRHEAFQEKKHPMQFGRIGAEQTQQMPEKQRSGASAKRSRYAICAASPVVVSVAVSQTRRPQHSARRIRDISSSPRVYFARCKYPLNSECFGQPPFSLPREASFHMRRHDGLTNCEKRILILTASFGKVTTALRVEFAMLLPASPRKGRR